ncbi:MAG: aspartate aminotransferase family protein [Chlamydiales bacterium]
MFKSKTEEIVALDKKYLMNTYNRYPIAIVKGDGMEVYDADGKKYLDFLGGIAVNVLGHCHPKVVDAIIAQVKELIHTSNLYYTKPAAELAELLSLNGGLDKIFFCNSGAEANEGAIKLSRKYQWRKGRREKYKIITATHSFHGRTLAALAATHKPEIQEGFGPLPDGFQAVPWNDTQKFLESIDETTAAVLIEPIQGEGGIHSATRDFLEKIRAACDRVGALLIFDEIQCGMGRSGTLFAYENFAVKPDVITLAKGIASGLPLGAICATNGAAEAFHPGDHGTTFGANPVAAAAALATLKVLIEENYLPKVAKMGALLMEKLHELQIKYPQAIAEVRGLGLMIGIELKIDPKIVLQKCHARGLLANVTAGNVLRLLPAYTITAKEIGQAVSIIESAIVG